MKVQNPDEVEFTLTVTMPLKNWKALKEQIPEKWPSYDLRVAITSMVNLADRTFRPTAPEPTPEEL